MREVFKAIGLAAATDEPVLIVGESGTGKELVASALHRHSDRAGGPVRPGQLRGPARGPDRERAVRPRAGRLHRRRPPEARPVRARRRRHDLPRRGRRAAPVGPGQAPPRPPAAGVRAGRRDRDPPDRRPGHLGHPPRPVQGGRRRPVPRGPVLPPQRRPDRHPAAPRPPRGHPAAGRAHPPPRWSGGTAGASSRSRPRPSRRSASGPGRGTSASWRTPWPGPRSPRGAGRSCPSTSTPTSRPTRRSPPPATPPRPCRSAPCWPRSSAGRSAAPCSPAAATAPRPPSGSASAAASSSTRSASTTSNPERPAGRAWRALARRFPKAQGHRAACIRGQHPRGSPPTGPCSRVVPIVPGNPIPVHPGKPGRFAVRFGPESDKKFSD